MATKKPIEIPICNYPQEIVGPFPQTLFLGCSVVDFNCNLGWGADSSTLTVNLVEDPSAHPELQKFKTEFFDKVEQLNDLNARSNITNSLALNTEDQENKRQDKNNKIKDPYYKDIGKLCGGVRWLDEDPGFLGSEESAFAWNQVLKSQRPIGEKDPPFGPVELMGCPALFTYGKNFTFGGIITSWKKDIGPDGIKYNVEIKNFANLLKNTQLIIGDYVGSVFNLIPNTNLNAINQDLGIPGPSGNIFNGPTASIKNGNMPNVINIYGYLESKGFGSGQLNDNGLPAYKIYDALVDLLYGKPLNPNSSPTGCWSYSQDKDMKVNTSNMWNPYGGLVCRGPARKVNPGKTNENYVILNTRSAILNGTNNQKISLADTGLLPTVSFVDGYPRVLLQLDISCVPRPPSWLRINGPVINILDFITQICEGAGFDFFVDHIPYLDKNAQFSGIIKIRTVSRRFQPKQDAIKAYIDDLNSNGVVASRVGYGQEYNDSIARTMYIGAKQKRLVQCKSHRFTWNQSSFAYDAFGNNGKGAFTNIADIGLLNSARLPNPASQRSQNTVSGSIAAFDVQNLPLTNNTNTNFSNQRFYPLYNNIIDSSMVSSDPTHNNILTIGNYFPTIHYPSYPTPNTFGGHKSSVPIYFDLVCPYYGKHYDGTIRKVYYDRNMGQIQVLFKIQDLFISGISLSFVEELDLGVKYFVVLENEIRAAGTGFEQWLSYCFDNGFFTDIEKLIYRAINRKYGGNATLDIGSIHKGVIDSLKNASFPNNISQFSYANAVAFSDDLYKTLEKIYELFNKIASEHYGKSYMISVPNMQSYRDLQVSNIVIGKDIGGSPIYAIEGDGKIYSDLEISTDGAWEEAGNYIDDAIIVGSINSSPLVNESNLIQPILGFNSSTAIDNRLINFWRSFYDKTLKQDSPYFFNPKIYSNPSEGISAQYNSIFSDINYSDYVDVLPVANNKSLAKTYVKCSIDESFEFFSASGDLPKAILHLPSPVYLNSTTTATQNLLTVMLHDSFVRYGEAFTIPGRVSQKPELPLETVSSNATKIAAKYIYNLGNFSQNVIDNFFKVSTDIGGLEVKLNTKNRFAGIIPVIKMIESITNACEISHIASLGEGLFPVFPFNNPGQSASSYNNAQILPKAAIPCFGAVPLQLNQAVYGPWINYPSLVAGGIFDDVQNKNVNNLLNRVENLIGGVKVVVEPNLAPWNFGSMTTLDKQIAFQIADDVNFQQQLENGSIELPIFPDIKLGEALNTYGPLVTQIGVSMGNGGITTNLSFRTYIRKFGLFNKENSDRLKSISLESIKRNKEIIAKYNELRDRIKTGEVGSATNAINAANFSIPKILKWSPSEILVGSNDLTINKLSDIANIPHYSPSYMFKPTYKGEITYGAGPSFKSVSTVTLQDFREAPKELMKNFNQKSVMSLDGIISPVSLFPTPHNTTFHITKYDTKICPICKGTKKYTYSYADPSKLAAKTPGAGSDAINKNLVSDQTIVCDFCEDKENSRSTFGFSEPDPPYILTNRSDSEILQDFVKIGSSGSSIIDYKKLNPVVLYDGEFSISGNRQKTDKSAHCINTVAYGAMPPNKYHDGMRPNYSNDIDAAYSPIDINYSGYIQFGASNNHRFFGLRGPLILHGWGYDIDGFPVPNQADEPVVSGQNLIRKSDGTILTAGEDPNDLSIFNRTDKFYNGWAQLPGTWPVGPVDLRWDRERKVWTVGDKDQYAFIVLEQDLTDIQPVRGALWNNSFLNNKPLPNGYRKLVFVKDNKGITAPRGAKIYCRYSKMNGFYEPLFPGSYVTSGLIQSTSTALIYNAYTPSTYQTSDKISSISEYTTRYENPMGLSSRSQTIGIFYFLGGKWILQSSNG